MGSKDPYYGYLHLKSTLTHHPAYAAKIESAESYNVSALKG